jgi:periplasmic copper chaperone A
VALGPALSAQAHVHVRPDSTVAGSDTELAFTVPSESPSASTTALSITLPQDHPFAEVSARVTPGWTVKVSTDALPEPVVIEGATLTKAAHVVTWTATSGFAIPPEQYQDFYLSVGPLPDSGDVMFTAKQTYSDGSVVAWDQPAVAGAQEPERPAPSFAITPAADAPVADEAEAEPAEEAAVSSRDGFSRLLGGAGLLAGLGAIGLMVARRSPRRPQERAVDEEKTLDLSAAAAGRPSA